MTSETALAKSEKKNTLAGQTFSDLERLGEAMRRAAKNANLIAPMVALDHIPVFHEVSLRVVTIDPETETFSVQGGRALSKTALAKLSAAARISWDAALSGRLDDGSDPHFVHFRAVGWWPDFDGKTVLQISGEKQLDLTEGSPMCVKLGKENQIQEMRAYILEHAESKARNRAIRQALALKGKYTEDELRRPFVVPALVETGRCDDSELRKLYFEKKLEGKGLATKALFQGGDPMLRPGDADVIEVKATPAKPRPVGTEYIDEETGEVKGDPDSSDDPFSG